MGLFRWMIGLPLAALATAVLFLAMAALIKREDPPGAPRETPELSIIAKLKPNTPPPLPPRTLPAPPEQPPIDRPAPRKPGGGDGPAPAPGPVDPIKFDGRRGTGGTIVIPPQYPDACRSKGVEGVVIVQFDITDRGEATNIQIISSPDRCFDRDVIRAVRGWRFPAEARRGVTETINFQFVE